MFNFVDVDVLVLIIKGTPSVHKVVHDAWISYKKKEKEKKKGKAVWEIMGFVVFILNNLCLQMKICVA